MRVDRAAVVKKADEFVSQGKLDLAIAEYRALLDEQPGDMGAANTLGDLYARAGDVGKAIEQFTRLAESERAQGFTSKAIALYKKALKVDPGCDEALSQLAEIAVGQELLADATLYWSRLVQQRRERNDAPGVAQALVRLAGLAVAKADTKLAAARAAEPHLEPIETARLYAAAAEALAHEGRDPDALDAWLDAAQRTDDLAVRQAAARACLASGSLDRAEPFLSVETAGDEPALLWAVGERAALAGDETVAVRALGRYRILVPDDAARASALLAPWEAAAVARVTQEDDVAEAWQPAASEEVDLAAMLADGPVDALVPAYEQVASDSGPEPVIDEVPGEETPIAEVRVEEARVEEVGVEGLWVEDARADEPAVLEVMQDDEVIDLSDWLAIEDAPAEAMAAARLPEPLPAAAQLPEPLPVAAPFPEPLPGAPAPETETPLSGDTEPEIDDAAAIAQLQAAADTPGLRFQAAAHLGRLFLQKGKVDLGVEWLERACAVPAPVREHGLAARYDLADALERAGQQDRALACWSDLEFDAGSYRDVADRLARLTRTHG